MQHGAGTAAADELPDRYTERVRVLWGRAPGAWANGGRALVWKHFRVELERSADGYFRVFGLRTEAHCPMYCQPKHHAYASALDGRCVCGVVHDSAGHDGELEGGEGVEGWNIVNKIVAGLSPPWEHVELQFPSGQACSIVMHDSVRMRERTFDTDYYTCVTLSAPPHAVFKVFALAQSHVDKQTPFGISTGHTFCSRLVAELLRDGGIFGAHSRVAVGGSKGETGATATTE
jgi:hypothetical protein